MGSSCYHRTIGIPALFKHAHPLPLQTHRLAAPFALILLPQVAMGLTPLPPLDLYSYGPSWQAPPSPTTVFMTALLPTSRPFLLTLLGFSPQHLLPLDTHAYSGATRPPH